MTMTEAAAVIALPYEMVSVEKIEPPTGSDGTWHEYVITQGDNTIHGCRQGSLAAVTEAVEEIVVRLNERRSHKRGRTHLIMKPKKPATT